MVSLVFAWRYLVSHPFRIAAIGITVAVSVFLVNFMASRQYRSFASLTLAPRAGEAADPATSLAAWWKPHANDRQVKEIYDSVAKELRLWYGPERLRERTTISLQDRQMQLLITVVDGPRSSSEQVALAIAGELRSDIAARGGEVTGRSVSDMFRDLTVGKAAETQPLGPDREDVYVGIISGALAAAVAAIVLGNGGIRSMLRSYRSQTT